MPVGMEAGQVVDDLVQDEWQAEFELRSSSLILLKFHVYSALPGLSVYQEPIQPFSTVVTALHF